MSKRKVKSKNFIIPLVIYPFDIMVSLGESDNKFKKAAKKILPDDLYNELFEDPVITSMTDSQEGRTIMLSGNQTIIRMKNIPQTTFQFGILAHEIFHAVTFIMDRIGMKMVLLKSDEAYAYLIGYITQEIYRNM